MTNIDKVRGTHIVVDGVPVRVPRGSKLDSCNFESCEVCYYFRGSYFTLRFTPEPSSSNVGTFALTVEAAHPQMEETDAVLPMFACEFLEGTGNARLARFLRAVCSPVRPVRKGASR